MYTLLVKYHEEHKEIKKKVTDKQLSEFFSNAF